MKWLFYIVAIALTYSCVPSRFVKPLAHKEHAVSASFGGALTNIPGVSIIPIPNTSIGYGYGLKPKTTVYGSWYSTAAIFGVFQMDAGFTQSIWTDTLKNMGISVSPSVNFMVDVFEKNARVWPQLDANYFFDYRTIKSKDKNGDEKLKTNNFYIGFTNWFELQNLRAHGETQKTRLLFCPQIGHTFERNKWNFSLEVKFLTPYASNKDIVVDYISPFGNRGGLGTYFGFTYKL